MTQTYPFGPWIAGVALALSVGVLPALPAAGQDMPVWSGEEAAGEIAPGASTAAPDLSGLRYFAQTGDERRYAREKARLEALYPNWRAPSDPETIPPAGDAWLEFIWDRVERRDHVGAQHEMALRRQADPDWMPSAQLSEAVVKVTARSAIIEAERLGRHDEVVGLAAAAPSVMGCEDLEVTWIVAEALARTGKADRAQTLYAIMIEDCAGSAIREATMRKALAALPPGNFETLVDEIEEDLAPGLLGQMRLDVARRVLADVAIAPEAVTQAHRDRVRDAFTAQGHAADATLLGWEAFSRDEAREAFTWFNHARAVSPSESAGIGFVLTALELGYFVDAEDVGYRWREASANAQATYMAAVTRILSEKPRFIIDADRIARMSAAVEVAEDAQAAQQLGWYAYVFGQFERAETWFRKSLDWKPDRESPSYGLALSLARQKKLAQASEIQDAWEGRSRRIMLLRDPEQPAEFVRLGDTYSASLRLDHPQVAPRPRIVEAYARMTGMNVAATEPDTGATSPAQTSATPRKSNAQTGSAETARITQASAQTTGCGSGPVSRLSPAQALQQGWCLMEKDRPVAAARAFERAQAARDAQAQRDAAYGLSLAKSRSGLTSQAALAASGEEAGSRRAQDLSRIILASRVTAAFEQKRYRAALSALAQHDRIAPRQTDLMVIEGWSYYHLGQSRQARHVFEAAARAGSSDAAKALETLTRQR